VDIFWMEQTERDVPSGDWWLSESERALVDWLHIPKRRADWRLGRWTAKQAVSMYFNLARKEQVLAGIELRPAPSGSPEAFIHGRAAPIHLSLSHSHGLGLCAIGRLGVDVGCDLETVEPRSPAFLIDYFTAEEQELVARTPVAGRDRMLTLLWSAKESTLKALRCGLRADTRSVNVAPADFLHTRGEEWSPVSTMHMGRRNFGGWWRIACDLVRTIVADSTSFRLVALEFPAEAPGCQGVSRRTFV
jgi:4'-phosphopantetheinyl transferase